MKTFSLYTKDDVLNDVAEEDSLPLKMMTKRMRMFTIKNRKIKSTRNLSCKP